MRELQVVIRDICGLTIWRGMILGILIIFVILVNLRVPDLNSSG
jgi:hypothetical protein